MTRPRIPVNEAGKINTTRIGTTRVYRSRCRFRMPDGSIVHLEAEGSSETKAEAALRDRIDLQKRKDDLGEARLNARSTVLDLVNAWLDYAEADAADTTKMERARRPQTLATYRNYTRLTIAPAFAEIAITECTTKTVQTFLEGLARTKPGAVKSSRSVLMNTYKWAVRKNLVASNVVRDAKSTFEIVKEAPKASRPITAEENILVFEAFDHDIASGARNRDQALNQTYRDILSTLAATGARIGEVLALDVDSYIPGGWSKNGKKYKPSKLLIDSTIVPGLKGAPTVQDGVTKSLKGFRRVTLPDWYNEVAERRVALARSEGRTLLFTTRAGTPISPANFRTRLRRVLSLAGLDGESISPHSWRKMVAETIRKKEGSAGVARQLGNDVATTERSYLSRQAEEAADFTEELAALNPDASKGKPDRPPRPRVERPKRDDDNEPF